MITLLNDKYDSPRYMEIQKEDIRTALYIQHAVLRESRRILDDMEFIEVLAPLIGPATDPGIRGAKRVSIDYYGLPYKVMSSMILYKQALIRTIDNIYALSPNIRLEPLENANSSRHLCEFYQLDLEMREKSIYDVMEKTELLLERLLHNVSLTCASLLEKIERDFVVPSIPFPKISYSKLYEVATDFDFPVEYGEEIPWQVEHEFSQKATKPFWIIDYPVGSRGFYYREDPNKPGTLFSMDLVLPEGFGEVSSGGEREIDTRKITNMIYNSGEKPSDYRWYIDMLAEDGVHSSGLGIGVERLTRYIVGYEDIGRCTAFAKIPGHNSI